MYSYDWIENLLGLNVYTIDYIDPKYQIAKPGDFWGFTPKASGDGPGVYVVKLDPNRAVLGCFGMRSTSPTPCTGTVAIGLATTERRNNTLILRARTDAASPMTGVVGAVFDPITFVMQRGMLLGFSDRSVEVAAADNAKENCQMNPVNQYWNEKRNSNISRNYVLRSRMRWKAHSLQAVRFDERFRVHSDKSWSSSPCGFRPLQPSSPSNS